MPKLTVKVEINNISNYLTSDDKLEINIILPDNASAQAYYQVISNKIIEWNEQIRNILHEDDIAATNLTVKLMDKMIK